MSPRGVLDTVMAALPDADQQMAWIEEIVGFGVRRPGSEQNARTVEWCAAQREALGYEVTLQPVPAGLVANGASWGKGRP